MRYAFPLVGLGNMQTYTLYTLFWKTRSNANCGLTEGQVCDISPNLDLHYSWPTLGECKRVCCFTLSGQVVWNHCECFTLQVQNPLCFSSWHQKVEYTLCVWVKSDGPRQNELEMLAGITKHIHSKQMLQFNCHCAVLL